MKHAQKLHADWNVRRVTRTFHMVHAKRCTEAHHPRPHYSPDRRVCRKHVVITRLPARSIDIYLAPRLMASSDTTSYPVFEDLIPDVDSTADHYELAFARSEEDLLEVQRLRFEVFNVELDEGLDESFDIGRDADDFDNTCHHLLVRDQVDGAIVGTYRMQTHAMADAGLGFYSSIEFDLSDWPNAVTHNAVELGRACIASDHRSLPVLNLLWRGLGSYLRHSGCRYLFGCSSLTSQDPREGIAMLKYFEAKDMMHPDLRVTPQPGYACEVEGEVEPATASDVPRLMRVYISTGARMCGPPAIDREFGTIDFLTFYDIKNLEPSAARFFGYQS